MTKKLNTTTKKKGGTKFTRKFREIVPKVVRFVNKTMNYIIEAMERLKAKYKKVTLGAIKSNKAGLLCGYIKLAL